MKANIKKRSYSTPQIDQIVLDKEISLILESPNGDPGDSLPPGWGGDSHYAPNDPMKVYDA